MTACTFIGSPETLQNELFEFIEETKIDELMVSTNIYDQQARLKSYSILSEVLQAAPVV